MATALPRHYAIASLAEAQAYLAHPILGPRLDECARLVLAVDGRTALDIFGSPDDVKLRSSRTLFAAARDGRSVFRDVLAKYFAGVEDPATLARLRP